MHSPGGRAVIALPEPVGGKGRRVSGQRTGRVFGPHLRGHGLSIRRPRQGLPFGSVRWLLVPAVVVLLAACSGGSAQDARIQSYCQSGIELGTWANVAQEQSAMATCVRAEKYAVQHGSTIPVP